MTGLNGLSQFSPFAGEILKSGSYKNIAKTRYVNDKQITDHYAIIPTGQGFGALSGLSLLSKRVYVAIVKRFLSIFYPPAVYQKISLTVKIGGESFVFIRSALKDLAGKRRKLGQSVQTGNILVDLLRHSRRQHPRIGTRIGDKLFLVQFLHNRTVTENGKNSYPAVLRDNKTQLMADLASIEKKTDNPPSRADTLRPTGYHNRKSALPAGFPAEFPPPSANRWRSLR